MLRRDSITFLVFVLLRKLKRPWQEGWSEPASCGCIRKTLHGHPAGRRGAGTWERPATCGAHGFCRASQALPGPVTDLSPAGVLGLGHQT